MLGRWVIHPSNPATQRIILKIVGFLYYTLQVGFVTLTKNLMLYYYIALFRAYLLTISKTLVRRT